MNIEALEATLNEKIEAVAAIGQTGEGAEKLDALTKDIEALTAQREKIVAAMNVANKAQAALNTPVLGAVAVKPAAPKQVNISNPRERVADDPRGGFASFADYLATVKQAGQREGGENTYAAVQRLYAAATTYGNTLSGTDGGFAIPPDFRAGIVEKISAGESLLPRTDPMTTSGNAIEVPVDETTPWQTSGGILSYWDGEAQAITASKPKLEKLRVPLHKLTALVPLTEELLSDTAGMAAYVQRKAPEKMRFAIDLAILQGAGSDRPEGILSSPALVTVAKETNQTADTIVAANIEKMWARMYAPCRRNAVWIVNQDAEPQLQNMTQVVGTGGVVLFRPEMGLASAPNGTLLGRPIVPHEAANALGDLGDIVLADLSTYMTVTKGGGARFDVSPHLYFDQDVTAFRFIMRIGGSSWWRSVVARRDSNNTNTLGCFVSLAARA